MTPQEQLELSLLRPMHECTPDEYRWGYYFPFRWLESHTGLDREIIRGFMRSMRNRGLVEYGHGFDEDGMTAGSGYTVTARGDAHLKHLETQLTLQQVRLREQARRVDAGADWSGVNYG